jgi:hypothetical protein
VGYQLWMREDSSGATDYVLSYNGLNYPNVRKFTMTGLGTGRRYSFIVNALNFNGAGPASAVQQVTICTAPTGSAPPTLAAVTKTTMELAWLPPLSDGGCPILSYSLEMAAATGTFSAVAGATATAPT